MEIQTEQPQRRQLTPFETYDLLFVQNLVNNLNTDNTVLQSDVEDFKSAWMFLYEEHKQLKRKFKQEQNNKVVLDNYRTQLAQTIK